MEGHQLKRFLVIAKTYPELSTKYGETVCTAAVDEDGNPVRLYPIPFRYLAGESRFQRYQWISANVSKNRNDKRPESYSLRMETIDVGLAVPATSDEWGLRAQEVFKLDHWQFTSMSAVQNAQLLTGQSLAFIRPRSIDRVSLQQRPEQDSQSFEEKFRRLKAENEAARMQRDLFVTTLPPSMKTLEYVGQRICVDWKCADADCGGHSMQILDWEICELARRSGTEAAQKKVESLLDSSTHRSGFFLGNFHMYPTSFAIIGLWYPKREELLF